MKKFGESWFRNQAKTAGYTLNEQGMMFSQLFDNKTKVRIYDGFTYTVSVLTTGHIVVVLDPKRRYFQEFEQFLQNNPPYSFEGSKQSIKVKVPSSNTGKWISGHCLGPTGKKAGVKLPKSQQSFAEFWKTKPRSSFCLKWDLKVNDTDKLYTVRLNSGIKLTYPVSVIRVSIDLQRLGQRPGDIPNSSSRIDETLEFASQMLNGSARQAHTELVIALMSNQYFFHVIIATDMNKYWIIFHFPMPFNT